jgi:hypothetical protein
MKVKGAFKDVGLAHDAGCSKKKFLSGQLLLNCAHLLSMLVKELLSFSSITAIQTLFALVCNLLNLIVVDAVTADDPSDPIAVIV